MKELSLNILDITENSVKAGASLTTITIDETDELLTLTIADDGCGMSKEILLSVTNPFYTTRTTRKVGMGIPLLKLAAEQTGGYINIVSKQKTDKSFDHGTTLTSTFYKKHIDFTPIGDIVSTILTLIQGHPDTDFLFIHKYTSKEVKLDTRQIKEIIEDIPINGHEIILWIKDNLNEQYEEFNLN